MFHQPYLVQTILSKRTKHCTILNDPSQRATAVCTGKTVYKNTFLWLQPHVSCGIMHINRANRAQLPNKDESQHLERAKT